MTQKLAMQPQPQGGHTSARSWPLVTVGMPCLNEERFIEACVRAVQQQDYPPERLELVVADGGSTDQTLAILARLSQQDRRIRVVHNPGRYQSAGMNEIIRHMRGDILVRLDVHGDYAPDYVRQCVQVLEQTGADNVGGAARARSLSWFQQALCTALTSPLGVGGSRYRGEQNEGFVDTVFNGAFRRRVFETVGMYDPRAITNEDAELNQRILQSGGRIYLSRAIVAYYYPRDSWRGLARQYFRYGSGRARTLLKHRTLPTIRPLLPFAFTLTTGALLAFPFQPLTPLVLGAYALGTGLEAWRLCRGQGLAKTAVVWAIFPTMHLCHGSGFAWGLWHYLRRPDWTAPERLAPRPPLETSVERTA